MGGQEPKIRIGPHKTRREKKPTDAEDGSQQKEGGVGTGVEKRREKEAGQKKRTTIQMRKTPFTQKKTERKNRL